MEKVEIRSVIKYLLKKGLTPKKFHADMVKVLGEAAPSERMVYKWANLFKRGRSSVEDDPRNGRPRTATKPEIIEQVHNMISEDPSLTKRAIAKTVGISDERVLYILHEELRESPLASGKHNAIVFCMVAETETQRSVQNYGKEPDVHYSLFVLKDIKHIGRYSGFVGVYKEIRFILYLGSHSCKQ